MLFGYAFLWTFLIILGLFGGFYGLALYQKSYNTVDIAYGLGFPLAALFMGIFSSGLFFIGKKIVTFLLVIVWGTRIAVMLTLRKYGKDEKTGEDRRFKKYREEFGKSASWKGFLLLYFPQALLVMTVGFPVMVIMFSATSGWTGDIITYIVGGLIWAIGFTFELVSDLQMWKFKSLEENKGKIMQSGLWAYSMHPNYFGEIMQWGGFFVLGLASPVPILQVLGLMSPIAIWGILMFVSGIPLQDKYYEGNEIYQEYRRNTNRLVPWFKKSAYSRKD